MTTECRGSPSLMTSELFRPRLPLDPFTALDHDIPWSIPPQIPLSYPQTILILGEPAVSDLIPLLTSTHISSSLVIIATHTPPLIPSNTRGPALRILRLVQPLAAHDAGALRLVSLFESAQRVVRFWPRDFSPHTIQLTQPSPNADFSIVESVSYANSTATELRRYPSPVSTSDSFSPSKRRSGLSPRKRYHRTKSPPDHNVPFDAIINFLPHGLLDKALLKHVILVTTLSAQFIAPPSLKPCSSPSRLSLSLSHSSASFPSSGSIPDTSPCPSPPPHRLSKLPTSKAKSRLSLLFHPTPPPVSDTKQDVELSRQVINTHLIHVLPLGWSPDSVFDKTDRRASSSSSPSRLGGPSHSAKTPDRISGTCKPKLVQSIEQFLLSFAYPLGSLVSGQSSSAASARPGAGLSLPSSNLNQRPKSALLSSTYEKERGLLRASTLPTPPSTANITNTNSPPKPVPYLLASGVFGSCVLGSDFRSRCSLPDEDDPEQSRDRDTRGDIYTNVEATALTIGEIILLGALDFDHKRPVTGPGNGGAWIGNVSDVVIARGSSDPDPGSREIEVVGKGKGREMMKTTMRNVNVLPSPPESLSSSTSAGSIEEEQAEEANGQIYAQPISPSSTHSSPTRLNNHGTPNTRSKRKSLFSLIISTPPTPVSAILNSKQKNTTSDKVKDKNSNRISNSLSPSQTSPLPLPSPVQLPPLVIHRDRARSPRGSEDNYDRLGLGHGVPVPPMTVSMTPGSRSASGSGLESSTMIPLQKQGVDARKSAYGETRSPKKFGSERKDFVGALKKMGLRKNVSEKSVGVGLKA